MKENVKVAHQRWDNVKSGRRAGLSPEERAESEARAAKLATALRVGIAIRDAREAVGITQTELAVRMGVAQSAVSRIEAGRASITVDMLTRIATALGTRLTVRIGDGEVPLAS